MSVNHARAEHEKSKSKTPFDKSMVKAFHISKVSHAVSEKHKDLVSTTVFQ
jgi:hypothetical protein